MVVSQLTPWLVLLVATIPADGRSMAGALLGQRRPPDPMPEEVRPAVQLLSSSTRGSAEQQQPLQPPPPPRLPRAAGVSLAGAVACSITHCMVVPLDVIKTRMQMDLALAGSGTLAAAKAVLRDAPGQGVLRFAAFANGLPPTGLGYFLQGATKFGGCELL